MFVWCIVFKTCLTFNNNNSNHHYDDSLNDRKKRILLLLLFGYDAMARQKKTLDSFVCKTRERKTNEYAVYNNRIQCKAYIYRVSDDALATVAVDDEMMDFLSSRRCFWLVSLLLVYIYLFYFTT